MAVFRRAVGRVAGLRVGSRGRIGWAREAQKQAFCDLRSLPLVVLWRGIGQEGIDRALRASARSGLWRRLYFSLVSLSPPRLPRLCFCVKLVVPIRATFGVKGRNHGSLARRGGGAGGLGGARSGYVKFILGAPSPSG